MLHCQDVWKQNLLSPEYPIVRVWCRFDMFQNKFHRDCPGQGTWHGELSKEYLSPDDDVKDLVENGERMWCNHCERGLIFPNTCTVHTDSD
jgi:hypothetical protein